VLAILVTMMSVSIYTLSFYKSGNVQQFLALVSAQFVIGERDTLLLSLVF